jgi:hypothetical protein
VYSAIWAKADRRSVRSVLLVALAMALVGTLYVPAQAQTGGAAAPSWRRGPQGAGARSATNGAGARTPPPSVRVPQADFRRSTGAIILNLPSLTLTSSRFSIS